MSPRQTSTRIVRITTRIDTPEAFPAREKMRRSVELKAPEERPKDHNPLAEEELVKEDATHGD